MKMLRRALLGGAAVVAMVAGAQAGELEALKAQLETLQNRVQTLETRGAALPEGASLITFERGSSASADALFANDALGVAPASRGATIAITPTADLPAPVASIELSGYTRGVALWRESKFDAELADFDLTARGQIDVKATVDTAIGRVKGGIQVRGDIGGRGAVNAANTGLSTAQYTPNLTIRTAWFTWAMTDALSLTMGQTGQIAALSNVGYSTLFTPFGLDSSRRPQIRLTYASGPFDLRFGIEDSSQGDTGANQTVMPDFAGSMGLNMGMFGFRVGGEVGRVYIGNDTGTGAAIFKTGYLVNAGVNMKMGSMIALSVGGVYTKGLGCDSILSTGGRVGCHNTNITTPPNTPEAASLVKAWGVQANMTLTMTETTKLVMSGGYYDAKNDLWDKGWSVGGALVWRPVDALQFAVEGDYAVSKSVTGAKDKDTLIGVAGWFFF